MLMHNPPRRRRRKRKSTRRRARRVHRRYGRKHRRNPGGMLIDMAKQAAPVLVGLYGARLLVNRIGPMLPGVSMLGGFQTPGLAILSVLGMNWATKKFGFLAKHRGALMLGTALNALDTLIKSFAPASLQSAIGVGDVYDRAMLGEYVQMGEYRAVGATPIDDDIAMSDYIAVGSDGVEEELGMVQEELGVDEELGGDGQNMLLGGVGQGSMLKTVPGRQFLSPIPARSFTRQIPESGAGYDNPGRLYQGIFRGGF